MQWLLSLAVASVAAALKTDASIQTSVGFSAPLPPTVYRTGTALLQQWQVEALARREQTAVTAVQSQQKAIEAIATEQKNQNDQQTTFQSQLRQVEVKERQLEDLLQRQTEELQVAQAEKRKAEVMLQEQSQAFLRARSLQVAVNNALEFGNDILRDQLLGAAVYFIFMMIMAKVYGMAFTYPYPKLHREPTVNRDHFTFSLFECCNWDPDAPSREAMRDRRIPCCSCCCGPIRWADTASSGKTKLVAFWPAAILAVAMNALASPSSSPASSSSLSPPCTGSKSARSTACPMAAVATVRKISAPGSGALAAPPCRKLWRSNTSILPANHGSRAWWNL